MIKVYAYYKTDKKYLHYKGERFFKSDVHGDTVVQVCLSAGEQQRGKGNIVGISIVSRLTLLSNYIANKYAIPCKKEEYEKAFEQVLEYLK